MSPKTIGSATVNKGRGEPFLSLIMSDGTWLVIHPSEIAVIRAGLDKLESHAADVLCDGSHADDDTAIIGEAEAREVLGQQTSGVRG